MISPLPGIFILLLSSFSDYFQFDYYTFYSRTSFLRNVFVDIIYLVIH